MQKRHQSIRIFKSDFLEKFTHVHPITPLVLWVPIICWFFWRSLMVHQLSVAFILSLGGAALFTWTFVEYVLHRFVFHFEGESAWTKRFHFILHGLHHEDPQDPTRLVMPPFPAVVIAAVCLGIFRLILGPVYCEPFFAFFVIGYLCYDYTHFAVHHFRPRTPIGRYLKQSHMVHHFVNPQSRWGVSSPLWDVVFGTYEAEKAGAKSNSKGTSPA